MSNFQKKYRTLSQISIIEIRFNIVIDKFPHSKKARKG